MERPSTIVAQNRRDHYIPQGYLRGFIDPERINQPQPLWYFDKPNGATFVRLGGAEFTFTVCSQFSRGRAYEQFLDGVFALLHSIRFRIPYAEFDGMDGQFVKIQFPYNGVLKSEQLRPLL